MGIKDNTQIVDCLPYNFDLYKVRARFQITCEKLITKEMLKFSRTINRYFSDEIFDELYGPILNDLQELKSMMMYYAKPETDVLRLQFLFDQIFKEIESKR